MGDLRLNLGCGRDIRDGSVLHVFLAPPALAVITADEITLFDGGDAGRVLWRKPENPGAGDAGA